MQTTLDKFYNKTRGPTAGLGSRFPFKGPAKRLFTDDQLKSESVDEKHIIDAPSPSTVELKLEDETVSETSLTDNICSTPTKSIIEPILKTESELDEVTAENVPTSEPDDELQVADESIPSTSKYKADIKLVPKTPLSKLVNEDGCSTPTRSPATQTVLRKQLRLGEYSKIFRDTKRTLSRKRAIDGSGDSETSPTNIRLSMNDIYASPKLKKFDMVQVEITSPVKRGNLKPRRLFGTSVASSPKKNMSYMSPSKLLAEGPTRSPQPSPRKLNLERVDYLLAEGKEALVLPRKYLDLEQIFHWIETVVKLRVNRRETVTFNTIRHDVQKAVSKRFTEEHIGKIIAVYPEAYNLSRELMKLPMQREKSYELLISIPDVAKSLEREKTFHDCLIKRTKIYHQKFLEQYDSSLQIPASEVKRWHSEFNLNDIPDIEPASLPQPPTAKDVALSAKDVLERTHAIVSGNKRLERAISTLSEEKIKTERPKKTEPLGFTIKKKATAVHKSLEKLPQSLIEKVRAKEAAKHAQAITRTPAAAKEAIMLSRLPEIARILRVVFVRERKSILPEELVLQAVGQSYKEKMSAKELKEHFELLSKHQPGWINSCKVENKPYIRLSKDADMTRVLGRLQKLIESS